MKKGSNAKITKKCEIKLGSKVKLGKGQMQKCYRKVKSKNLNKNSNFVYSVDPEKTFKFTMTFFSVGFIVF